MKKEKKVNLRKWGETFLSMVLTILYPPVVSALLTIVWTILIMLAPNDWGFLSVKVKYHSMWIVFLVLLVPLILHALKKWKISPPPNYGAVLEDPLLSFFWNLLFKHQYQREIWGTALTRPWERKLDGKFISIEQQQIDLAGKFTVKNKQGIEIGFGGNCRVAPTNLCTYGKHSPENVIKAVTDIIIGFLTTQIILQKMDETISGLKKLEEKFNEEDGVYDEQLRRCEETYGVKISRLVLSDVILPPEIEATNQAKFRAVEAAVVRKTVGTKFEDPMMADITAAGLVGIPIPQDLVRVQGGLGLVGGQQQNKQKQKKGGKNGKKTK